MRFLTKRSVMVNTKSGRSFRGVLWQRKGPYVVLKDAVLHDPAGLMPVDGEVVVHRENIDFIQILATTAEATA